MFLERNIINLAGDMVQGSGGSYLSPGINGEGDLHGGAIGAGGRVGGSGGGASGKSNFMSS